MTSIQYAYLGKAGSMKQLVQPMQGFESGPNMGDAAHTLLSGGTAVVKNLYPKRLFTLPYDVTAANADVILGFYQGIYGAGPWRFVDPTVRNVLRLDASICGARLQADDGWVSSSGALTAAGVGTGPAGVDSGMLNWTAVASATLQPGVVANVADTATAPVYLPAEPCTVSVYVKASGASSGHTLELRTYDAAGAVFTASTTSMSLTTSFQRFSVSVAANFAPSAFYVLPRIVLGASVPTTVSIAGAQVEYGDTVSTWQPGFGCPRVTISAAPGRSIPAPGYRAHTLTLAEV